MANSIAHLAVAHEILVKCPGMVSNTNAYYLGSLAPDAISSKPGAERNDKRIVHLREDIRDADWLLPEKMKIFKERIEKFAKQYATVSDGGQRDFNIGYLVHLLTDEWNHRTVRQVMLRIANTNNIQQSDRAFYHMMVNDLEALDQYLLHELPNIEGLFFKLMNEPIAYCLPGLIEKEYLAESMVWWKCHYVPSIGARKLLYITTNHIDDFIEIASENIAEEVMALIEK